MRLGVDDEIGQRPFDAVLVAQHRLERHAAVDVDLRRWRGAADHLSYELTEPDGLEPQRFGAGLRLAELQQLFDDHPKVTDLGDQEVDRRLEPLREFLAAPLEYVGGRSQRGEWRTQLVAHVGDEPGVAVDAGLERVRHVIERVDDRVEVGVALRRQAGGEVACRDRRGDAADFADGRSARRPAQIPTKLAAKVVTIDVPIRTLRSTSSVERSSTSAATSKYVACTAVSGTPSV